MTFIPSDMLYPGILAKDEDVILVAVKPLVTFYGTFTVGSRFVIEACSMNHLWLLDKEHGFLVTITDPTLMGDTLVHLTPYV